MAQQERERAFFQNVRCFCRATCGNMAEHRILTGGAWRAVCAPCAMEYINRGPALIWFNGEIKPNIAAIQRSLSS